MIEIVKKDGMFLKHANGTLKNNFEICLEAAKSNGLSL
jgi:hypothetical protein